MSNNAILGFRTITKAFLTRYHYTGSPPVLTPVPVSILVPPSSAEIDPGVGLGEIMQRNCTGAMQTAFTYKDKIDAKVKLSFDVAGPELEQMIHGQVVKTFTNVIAPVQFECDATTTTFPGRAIGQHGYQVAAQTNGDYAMAYYTDPLTKQSVELEIVAANPTGDQIAIGEHLALTLSPELAATGYRIYGRVDAQVSSATGMSSEQMGLVGVYLSGIYFDGSVREFSARYCSLDYGSSLTAENKRSINLRILPDPQSRSGLGWDVTEIPLQMAC